MPDRFFCHLTVATLMVAGQLQAVAQGLNRPGPSFGGSTPRAELAQPQGPESGGGASMERPTTLLDPNRRLQQGDELTFKIEQDKEPAIPLVVSHTGEIVVDPLPNAVKVAGLTTTQASQELKRLLEKDYYYNATVRLTMERANVRATMGYVYLDGLVNRIGALPIYAERPMKLSEAILMAGGFSRYAKTTGVKVTRNNPGGAPTTTVCNLKEVMEKGQLDLDVTLKDGDRIYVPKKFVEF